MFSNLYPITFILSLALLTAWFYHRDHERRSVSLRNGFLAAFAVFGLSWLLADGTYAYKVPVLMRELMVLAAVPVFLSVFRKVKWAYFGLLVLTLFGLRTFYFEKLKASFPQKTELPVTASDVQRENRPDADGEWLIEIREGRQLADIQAILEKYELSATPAFTPKDAEATDLDDYFVVNVPAERVPEMPAIRKELEAAAAVEWLEENEQVSVAPIPVEAQRRLPGLNQKYGLNDPGLENLWGFESMNVADLYPVLKSLKPKKEALIAIIDTGVDAGHEDLKDNFTSTQSKYDTDKAGHGTHCAGIAAAVSNNGRGVASFSQTNDYVQVTSVKVLSDGGFGTQQTIINGILEAADRGADVLSMSLGGLSTDSRQRAYEKAIEYATKKGGIVVVAAGNSNRNGKDFVPANVEGVISVSAVDTLLGRASFSNTMQDLKWGVAAPGVKIYSTVPGSDYRAMNGTSMATPYVAGLLGLLKSLQPDLTAKEAYEIMNASGADTKDTKATGKLIQPAAAVRLIMNDE